MNRAKSALIGLFPMFAMVIAGYASFQLYTTRLLPMWLPPLLTTIPFIVFL